MEILVITLFGLNLGWSIVKAITNKEGSRSGWFSSAMGWTCAILGYAAFYGWIG